jgi:hypothetical protein
MTEPDPAISVNTVRRLMARSSPAMTPVDELPGQTFMTSV